MALSTLEIIMLIANVVFIIIAVFLFIRLRKIEKKPEPEVKQPSELSGIADITPVEFNRERFGIEEKERPEPEKTIEAGEVEKIEASTIAELKLEDELPEVEEKETPSKKRAAAKKVEMKVPEETVVEKQEVHPEKIEIPEKIEFKFEEKEPEKEEEKIEKKPEKTASKKNKSVKKEPAVKKETKPAPRKKPAKKKKSLI